VHGGPSARSGQNRRPTTLGSVSDTAYFVMPPDGPGPGVLVLHSWWGLTPFFRRLADRLADEGFTVLVPDLNMGETFEDQEGAQRHLAEADANRLARLVLDSAQLLAERSSGERIGAVGFSMGASLALWASVRLQETVGAVSAFYGTQSIDFAGAAAAYQLHYAESDHLVSDDDAVFMEATMGMEGLEVEAHRYPGTKHWFFETDSTAHESQAAELAFERTVAFLKRCL
jgi:carboxymethylenebutenolidase